MHLITAPLGLRTKTAKVRPLMEDFVKKSQKVITPGKYMSLDEGMTVLKEKFNIKCYLPDKPDKYDIKLLLLVNLKQAMSPTLKYILK